nr:MAG TPA: adenine-specific methyltransferase [Caudoviricetes sp.]
MSVYVTNPPFSIIYTPQSKLLDYDFLIIQILFLLT